MLTADEHGAFLGILDSLTHVTRNRIGVVGDDHGASAEHIAGTDQHRVADALADG